MDLLCKCSDGRYVNVEIQKSDNDDHQRRVRYNGSKIAKLMKYMVNTQGECPEFPRLSRRVKYYKEKQGGVKNMGGIVEEYAKQHTEKMAETYAANLFRNGVSFEIVSASFVELTSEKIRQIYDMVKKEQ